MRPGKPSYVSSLHAYPGLLLHCASKIFNSLNELVLLSLEFANAVLLRHSIFYL